jgi:predicted TIM-barrel fold metal-dependent hydrolase
MSANAGFTVDTHAHVFHRGLPFVEARRFTPTYDAPLEAYLRQLDDNGVSHGVIVALSILGTDNTYMLESLRREPRRLRGVVAIDPAHDLAKFDDFSAAGVVGVRVNLSGGLPVPDFASGAWADAVAECSRRDWHIEINDRAGRLHESLAPLIKAGTKVVVDHFGMPDRELGMNDPGLRDLLEFGRSGLVWVKLSGAYRSSAELAKRAAPGFLDAFGAQRLLWASDWPFTGHESTETYAPQRARLDDWLPDETIRRIVLDDTPRRLFQF